MGLYFSDVTNRTGIIQLIEDRTNTVTTTTSSYSLTMKTRDVNLAFAKFMSIAVDSAGRWQVDDTNQEDFPEIYTDLISGQEYYSFTQDGSTPTNQILDIHRVELRLADGTWKLLRPIDMKDVDVAIEALASSGVPEFYDKTSNALFLYPTPNYNMRLVEEGYRGLKFYYSRTPHYFESTDTNNQAGIPDMFHEYLVLRPSYLYCLSKGLTEKANHYKAEMLEMEEMIKRYYGSRQRDEDPMLSVRNNQFIDKRGIDGQVSGNVNNMTDWR